MKKVILLISLFVIIILLSGMQAQVYNVDLDIQEIYKLHSGISLEQAIQDLESSKLSDSNKVIDKPDSLKSNKRQCYFKSSNPNIVPVKAPIDTLKIEFYKDYPGVREDQYGNIFLDVLMFFEGNISDLEAIGVVPGRYKLTETLITVKFPLKLLPEISKVNGVKRIASPTPQELK